MRASKCVLKVVKNCESFSEYLSKISNIDSFYYLNRPFHKNTANILIIRLGLRVLGTITCIHSNQVTL